MVESLMWYTIESVEDVEDGWLLYLDGATFIDCPRTECQERPRVGETGRWSTAVTVGNRIYRSPELAGCIGA